MTVHIGTQNAHPIRVAVIVTPVRLAIIRLAIIVVRVALRRKHKVANGAYGNFRKVLKDVLSTEIFTNGM